jgi:hypothetical protein
MAFLTSFGMTGEREWAGAAGLLRKLLRQRWFELIRKRGRQVIPKQRFRTTLSGGQRCPLHTSPPVE